MASDKMFPVNLACSIFSLFLLLQLAYRCLIGHLGEWFARNCVMSVVPALSLLGTLGTLAMGGALHGRIFRLCCWIPVGIAFMDMKYISDTVAEAAFSSCPEQVTDLGILTRGAFVSFAGSWVPAVSIGFLLCSYMKSYFVSKKDIFMVNVVVHALGSCSVLMLWIPEPPYPDCSIPLLGFLVSCTGLVAELPKSLRLLGSILVVSGLSYAFNSYLSCSYCGKVEPQGNIYDPRHLHMIWKCPLRSGNILQVVEGTPNGMEERDTSLQLRAMRLGHSMMGGIWIEPQSVYGVSIFSAFYLQAAGALFTDDKKPNQDKKSLHIGLGVGTSVNVLQEIGYSTDCMELHPEILAAAKEFFNLHGAACQIGDAGRNIHHISLNEYDLINLDIFSGDTDMSLLKKHEFFRKLSRSMMQPTDSILVVNFFGLEGQQLKKLYEIVKESFVAVRLYREEESDDVISNFVLIASNSGKLLSIDPVPRLFSEAYATVFNDHRDSIAQTLKHREISATRDIKTRCKEYKSMAELFSFKACVWMESMWASGAQWRSFKSQFA